MEVIMNDLVMLLLSIITTIVLAAFILALSEAVIIAISRLLTLTIKSNSTPLDLARRRSIGEDKARSCPFC